MTRAQSTGWLVCALLLTSGSAFAKPTGPTVFCETYPESPNCLGGKPACTYCHTAPPARNKYGDAVAEQLLPAAPRPLSDADYNMALPNALRAIEAEDTDGDGHTNLEEIMAGTSPFIDTHRPGVPVCEGTEPNPSYKVCARDKRYVFKRLHLDFCGRSPTYEAIEAFVALDEAGQDAQIATSLDACLQSEFWLRRDGAVWRLAHRKIRPLQALKSGRDSGLIPLGDYDDDYNLFVYANTGDRDVRDVLRAKYFVSRSDASRDGEVTLYNQVTNKNGQAVQQERRAGLLTTKWNLIYHVMFTALPRTAAAQAYRGFLNLDIARLEGLQPIAGEPRDWDGKGVTDPQCVVCHSTLDPLSYPFKNYTGLDASPFGRYDANRTRRFRDEAPTIMMMPEEGAIFGQPVSNLVEWADIAANSPEYARAVVEDYWKLVMGESARPHEQAEFDELWKRLMTDHNYRVRGMLHELVKTEAYSVP